MKKDENDDSIYIYIYIQLIDIMLDCNHILDYTLFIRHLTLQNIIISVQNYFFLNKSKKYDKVYALSEERTVVAI